jgi:hypothetical protein
LITLLAPCLMEVAMQSVPVSPPPITITCSTGQRQHALVFMRRQSAHTGMHQSAIAVGSPAVLTPIMRCSGHQLHSKLLHASTACTSGGRSGIVQVSVHFTGNARDNPPSCRLR